MTHVRWDPAWQSLEGPTCNFQLQSWDCAQGTPSSMWNPGTGAHAALGSRDKT